MLDTEAGAHATLKSANPYPFGMLLLCEGVGSEPPLQRFEQGGVEIGGIRLGAKLGCTKGVEGGGRRRALCYVTVQECGSRDRAKPVIWVQSCTRA